MVMLSPLGTSGRYFDTGNHLDWLLSIPWGKAKNKPIDLGLAGGVLAFGIAMHRVAQPHAFAVFIAAGALILTIAVLQDTFRMAFRDELTGMPSRRELNERMRALGRRYTIAMVDVDRFKNFNDKYATISATRC